MGKGRLIESCAVGRLERIVAIHEGDIFAPGLGKAQVAGRPGTAVDRGLQESELLGALVISHHLAGDIQTGIRVAVVHEDHFDILHRLGLQSRDARGDIARSAIDRNNQGDVYRVHRYRIR